MHEQSESASGHGAEHGGATRGDWHASRGNGRAGSRRLKPLAGLGRELRRAPTGCDSAPGDGRGAFGAAPASSAGAQGERS